MTRTPFLLAVLAASVLAPSLASAAEVVAAPARPSKPTVTTTDEARPLARVVTGSIAPSKPAGARLATTSDEARPVARVVTDENPAPTKLAARMPNSTDQARGIDVRPAAPVQEQQKVACGKSCSCGHHHG